MLSGLILLVIATVARRAGAALRRPGGRPD
jgi:hypothetical protein